MSSIMLSIISVSAIGLIAAIVLSVASKVMAVPVDERFGPVRDCLPGANCGACGFAGCDAYAQALISEEGTKANLCTPGGPDTAKALGAALGVAVEEVAAVVAAVKCNGNCNNTNDKMDYQSAKTCKGAKLFFGGKGECSFGCLGLGDCAVACPHNAIYIVNGVAIVDTESCVGCGICTKACPNFVIEMVPATTEVRVLCNSKAKGAVAMKACKVSCIGCKKCEKICPADAITVTDNLAHIDQAKCVSCGACVKECPKKSIHVVV